MKVLVTGATGFIGRHVCRRLQDHGWRVVGVARRPDNLPLGVEGAQADVVSGDGLREAMQGVQAVVHLVGIIRESAGASFEQVHVDGTRNVVATANEFGVPRLVHMSALGAIAGSLSGYQHSKAQAEELVRESGLAYTIMRPSLVFGAGDAFFGGTLKQLVTGPPVVPVVGDGSFLFRPIWVEDVANAFSAALRHPETEGRAFNLVGPREYTLRQLLEMVRNLLRPGKPLMSVPLPLMRLAVTLFRLVPNPPITPDQFLMLLAGNTADPKPAVEALGLELAGLEDHLTEVLGVKAS